MIRTLLGRGVTRCLTSASLLQMQRQIRALPRRVLKRAPQVWFFHRLGDPYSLLAAQYLEPLADRHGVHLQLQALPPATSKDSPQHAARERWAERDVLRLARRCGIALHCLRDPVELDTSPAALARGELLQRRAGHELAAMFAFEGEWYSGVDRLHHLERRVGGPECVPLFAPPELIFGTAGEQRQTVIDFYCSLRSPYTYLACERLAQLATHYRASVRLRFLLPMVKRGVPLSRAKRLYIVRDAAREARRLGLPFGDIADPLGAPAERGLALLHHAIQQNRGTAFLASFLRGVFAEGIDAGSAAGLRNLARRAGIKTCEIDAALANLAWRDEAEHNRQALEARGLWGVPSFAVEGRAALWGQDRLWMLEEDLRGDPQ